MPTRLGRYFLLILVFGAGCATRLPDGLATRPFMFETDRLAFANQTVWHYEDGKPQFQRFQRGEKSQEAQRYTRRCFVLCRSVVQFWKFARFDPDHEPLPDAELVRRVKRVKRTSAWRHPFPEDKRICFPGYENLFEFSSQHPEILRDNLGFGWTTYFRLGNSALVFPSTRNKQQLIHERLESLLQHGIPVPLWLINFPSLSINHAVVVYKREPDINGRMVYNAYDPNFTDAPKSLEYDPRTRSFYFPKTFYFNGGRVTVKPIYQAPFQ